MGMKEVGTVRRILSTSQATLPVGIIGTALEFMRGAEKINVTPSSTCLTKGNGHLT